MKRHISSFVCLIGVLTGLLCVSILASSPSVAQVISLYDIIYRPAGEKYLVAQRGPHRIIYPLRREAQARDILSIIQETKPATGLFLGVQDDFQLNIVLTDQSHSGNGFVSPLPFKTEIESVALRGRELSRRHDSWVQVVTTHELVHAAQASFRTNKSLVGVIGRFSPDFARALGLFLPSGYTEGLAVFRESQVPKGAGRLNHPYFLMQARAGVREADWSLSQLLEEPSYTRPFDRFYKGGALFTQFFVTTYGREAVTKTLKWQQQIPISGFGFNLQHATGDSPAMIEERFRQWFNVRENALVASLGTLSPSTTLDTDTGRTHRRPYWISDSQVVSFDLGYNLARGFQVTSEDGHRTRLSRNEITDDAMYSITSEGLILYSRYEEHPLSPRVRYASSWELNPANGRERRMEGSSGVFNPVRLSDGRSIGLRSDGQYTEMVLIDQGNDAEIVLKYPALEFVSLAPRPSSDSLAVIAKVGDHQALFLVDASKERWTMRPWIGFEGSTIYDASWNKTGRYLSFTSDRTGILNVYVLDAHTERIRRVTNVLYAAMEGHVNSDGTRVTFVEYGREQFDLKIASVEGPWVEDINRDQANATWSIDWEAVALGQTTSETTTPASPLEANTNAEEDPLSDSRPYRSLRYLSPRMLYPTLYLDNPRKRDSDARLGFGIGVAAQGTDPLQRHVWYGEGIVQKNNLWGEVGFQTAALPFRPGVSLERRPSTVDAVIAGQEGTTRVIRDRVAMSAFVQLPFTIEQNVDRTSLISQLSLSYRSDRFVDDDFNKLQQSRSYVSLLPSLFYGRKLLRNPRDIAPTSGQSLSWFGDWEVSRDVGEKRRGWIAFANWYVPLMRSTNTSIRLNTGMLQQNNPSIFGLTFFKPPGWDGARLLGTNYIRYGVRVTQPVLFPDNGWLTFPGYVRALYVTAGADAVQRTSDSSERYSSVSFGAGLKLRFLHFFDFNLSYVLAYRTGEKDWQGIWDVVEEN